MRPITPPKQTNAINLDGQRLIYSAAGSPLAPPLIMLHGWMSYRGVWASTIDALQGRYYCIALDLLGSGESDKPAAGDYTIDAQARRVLALADALGLPRFGLIGHSMGGQIALRLAALAPERAAALVNIAGVVAGRLKPEVEQFVYRLVELNVRVPLVPLLARPFACSRWGGRICFHSWFYQIERVPWDLWRADRAMAAQLDIWPAAYRMSRAIRSGSVLPYLGQVQARTLTLFGRHDGVVPLRDAYLAQERIADSQLLLLDNCGHFPMYEQPEAYIRAVQGFLGQCPWAEPAAGAAV